MAIKRSDVDRIIKTASMLRRVWLLAVLVGLYSLVAVGNEYSVYGAYVNLPSSIFSMLGLVLSLVLVFRTNRAYERWWEARTLWGKQVNISRNLAIKMLRMGAPDAAERERIHRLISGFGYALKDHLREGASLRNLPGWEEAIQFPKHVPAWLVSQIYEIFDKWRDSGRIDGDDLIVLDQDAREFLNVCGGCERIRNTLIAGSYRMFSIKALSLYLVALPWGYVEDLQWLTIPVSMIMTYVLVGLEAIADDVEQPFGYDLDDLDLEKLCNGINESTAEILETTALPAV